MILLERSGGPVLALLLESALGVYVIYWARRFYARPDDYIGRWQRWLPQETWTWIFVRGWVCICIWGGTLLVCASILQLLPILRLMQPPAGFGRILVISVATLVSTYCLLPRNSLPVKVMKSITRS